MSELKPDKPKEVQDQTHHNQMLKAKDQIIIIFKIEGKVHIIDREWLGSSSEAVESRNKWISIVLKGENCQPGNLEKMSFRNEDEMRIFSD